MMGPDRPACHPIEIMVDYFSKNISALTPQVPHLSNLRQETPVGLEILTSKKDGPTARYDQILLHSAYDPMAEAKTFARQVPTGGKVCLYGFGLGYHIPAILKKLGPEGALLVIELNATILTAALTWNDYSNLADDSRFRLVFADNEPEAADQISEAMSWLFVNETEEPDILFHAPSFQCLPESFSNIANALEVLRMERRVPLLFGNIESRNFKLNQETVLNSPGIRQYQNRFPNQPGLLISAGPSLDGLYPLLPLLSKKCITGCVDTALPTLLDLGARPDFVFSLDPQDESFSHFTHHLDCPSPLIFTPTANPRVIRHYSGDKIVVFKDGHQATQHLEDVQEEKGATQAGGSVACLGLDALIQMGCNPIILAGQDCAFSGNRSYARTGNSATSVEAHRSQTRQQPQIQIDACQQDQKVTTNHVLFSYLRTLEQIADAHPDIQLINFGSHGADIANATALRSIKELMTLLPECDKLPK